MSPDEHLEELLLIWQEAQEAGRDIPVDQLCSDCPELIATVQQKIAILRRFAGYNQQPRTLVRGSEVTLGLPNDHDTIPINDKLPVVPGYELIGVLGRGGMGIVYEARQVALNRIVALKMVLHADLASAEDLTRFLHEAETIAKLQHPHIVQIHDRGSHNGRPWFALEFIDGGSLGERIDGTPQDPKWAAQIVVALARTVQVAHDRGIIHRDLKPANVLMTTTYEPRITDFGLARQGDSGMTQSGVVLGTPSYMAPEQAAGHNADIGPACDVYALGAILYECLTGRPPFRGTSPVDTIKQVLERDPVPVRQLSPGVSRDLETICMKCLEKPTRNRYTTAGELADDLQRQLDGLPILARPIGWIGRLARWANRHPSAALLYATLLVGGVVLLALGFWFTAQINATQLDLAKADSQRIAAQKQVETEQFFSALLKVRERAARPKPGWTWQNLADIADASKLGEADRMQTELRDEAITALGSADVRRLPSLPPTVVGNSLAWHPKEHIVAVGERGTLLVPTIGVNLADLRTNPPTVRTLVADANTIWRTRFEAVPDIITSLAFSPDGRWLVAGSRSGMVHRWDLDKGDLKAESWPSFKATVWKIVFSRDNSMFYAASNDEIQGWSMVEGKSIARYPLKGGPESLCVHPIDGWVAITSDYQFHRLNARTLQPLRGHIGQGHACGASEFTPDGRFLIVESARSLQLWDSEVRERTQSLRFGVSDYSHDAMITHLSVSPNNLWLGSSSRGTGNVRLWELMSGRPIAELVIGTGECNTGFSFDSRYFVALSEKETHLFEMRLPLEQTMAALTTWPVNAMSLRPDGRTLAIASGISFEDMGEVTLRSTIDETAKPKSRMTVMPWDRDSEHRIAFTASGDHLGWTHADTERMSVWDLLTSKVVYTRRLSNCAELIGGPANRLWGAFEHKILAINADDGTLAERLDNQLAIVMSGKGTINGLAIGDESVLVAGRDGNLRLLPLDEQKKVSVVPVTNAQLRRVAWLSDRNAVVTDDTGYLRFIDTRDGRVWAEQVAHSDRIDVLSVSRNGLIATSGPDGVLQVGEWDGGDWRPLFHVRYPQAVLDAAFQPDGVRLFVRLRNERGVRVWHLDRLRERLGEFVLSDGLEGIHPLPVPTEGAEFISPNSIPLPQPIPSNGLWCEQYGDMNLVRRIGTRYDDAIDFDWGKGHGANLPADNFGMRWTGWLKVPKSGKYTFLLNADDRARMWLDGHLVLDVSLLPFAVEVELDEQPHHVRIEYSESSGDAKIRWSWSQAGGFTEQAVPKEFLFPVKPQ